MDSYLTPLALCEEFARGIHPQSCYTTLQLRYFPISLIKIKGTQIRDHEIQIINFANDTTIFLRDFTCLNRIQVIFKTIRKCIWFKGKHMTPYIKYLGGEGGGFLWVP